MVGSSGNDDVMVWVFFFLCKGFAQILKKKKSKAYLARKEMKFVNTIFGNYAIGDYIFHLKTVKQKLSSLHGEEHQTIAKFDLRGFYLPISAWLCLSNHTSSLSTCFSHTLFKSEQRNTIWITCKITVLLNPLFSLKWQSPLSSWGLKQDHTV